MGLTPNELVICQQSTTNKYGKRIKRVCALSCSTQGSQCTFEFLQLCAIRKDFDCLKLKYVNQVLNSLSFFANSHLTDYTNRQTS